MVVLVVVLLAALSAAVWAGQGRGAQVAAGQGPVMMGPGPVGMAGVAASGNDVYVVIHGDLLKYNSDLILVKQVELPRGEAGMGGGRGGGARGRRGGRGGEGRGAM
jgi:hypothetical protein